MSGSFCTPVRACRTIADAHPGRFKKKLKVSSPFFVLGVLIMQEVRHMQSRIAYLLDRFVHSLLTEAEQEEWQSILQDPEYESLIQEAMAAQFPSAPSFAAVPDQEWDAVLHNIYNVDRQTGFRSSRSSRAILRPINRRMAAAAVILLAVVGGADYLLLHRKPAPVAQESVPAPKKDSIHPGTNKAILTLANGQQILLDDAHNGVIGQQGNTKVIKLDGGQLAYAGGGASGQGPMYNTIATPRGGQYQIILPDGTKVWLDAASSLRFPTAFTTATREVQLTGEAYFEVRASAEKPFIVKAKNTTTQVLGTDINIMAYDEEGPVKTTLIQGAVKLGEGAGKQLAPGEQGVFGAGGVVDIKSVNIKAVTAWKDGYYFFERTPVQNVMRQIARWYDVDIVYSGGPPADEIVGRIPRAADVREVLHIMELIGIRFKIEGKTITVLS